MEGAFEVIWFDSIQTKEASKPLINGNLVIPAYGGGYCYLAGTGKRLHYNFAPDREIIMQNMFTRYVLFRNRFHSIIFDLETGKELFRSYFKHGGSSYARNPYRPENMLIEGNLVFYANSPKSLVCFDMEKMEERWEFSSDFRLYEQPVEHGQEVFIASDKYLYAIDLATGKEIWKLEIGENIGNIQLLDDIIYATAGIVAIDIKKREIIYHLKKLSTTNKLIIIDDLAYFIHDRLYCITKKDRKFVFYTEDYRPCHSDRYFIYKNLVFGAYCNSFRPHSPHYEVFDRFTGEKTHELWLDSLEGPIWDFFVKSSHFSEFKGNMLFTATEPKIIDKFAYIKIYGVRIRDDKL